MTKKLSNMDKLKHLISDSPSQWHVKAEWREKNESHLDLSFSIALKILRALRSQNMSQKDLALQMNVTPQYINKVLKGAENLSLETITRIGGILNIDLVSVVLSSEKIRLSQRKTAYTCYAVPKPVLQKIIGKEKITLAVQSYEESKSKNSYPAFDHYELMAA
jgi:transcriptional regulator with XRE-family HTH domain